MEKWHNVRGTVDVDIACEHDKLYDCRQDTYLSERMHEILLPVLPAEDRVEGAIDLVIQFTSSGYYDPGQRSGPPERCYPPEGDDERTLVSVHLDICGSDGRMRERIELPEELAQEIFDEYESLVEEEEI